MATEHKYSCQKCGSEVKSTDVTCATCGCDLTKVGRNIQVTINESISLVESRLLQNPAELAKFLPPLLSNRQVVPFTYFTEKYFILALVKREEKNRLKEQVKHGLMPFPYLIKPEGTSGTSAFVINNSRNMFLSDCTVENSFAMDLGKDSTIILYNHTQINKAPNGLEKYTIPLAYVISFGELIKQYNVRDFLQDLIAYSVKQWKQTYG